MSAAMKADELRVCDICHQPLLSDGGLPLFWRVNIERMHINVRAAQQILGLSTLLRSQALAQVMGTNPDAATPIHPAADQLLVCERCGIEALYGVAGLAEVAADQLRRRQEQKAMTGAELTQSHSSER